MERFERRMRWNVCTLRFSQGRLSERLNVGQWREAVADRGGETGDGGTHRLGRETAPIEGDGTTQARSGDRADQRGTGGGWRVLLATN
ncbi:MAG: hypothetical protein P8X95_19435 [Anaerolineales bacterium]